MDLYEYQPTMYHCKVLVVDDLWVSVGSTNFDDRSFRLNDEANLNISAPSPSKVPGMGIVGQSNRINRQPGRLPADLYAASRHSRTARTISWAR